MIVDIRVGTDFSEDDLRPEIYETAGGFVRAELFRGGGIAEIDALLATYTINGKPSWMRRRRS